MSRVRVLGIDVDRVSLQEAAATVSAWLEAGRPRPGAVRIVVTPNAEMIYAAQFDPELRQALAAADLTVPDGAGVVWAARRLRRPVPERVPGIELAEAALSDCGRHRRSAYLLGGRPGVAERAAEALVRRHPGLRIAGARHGYFAEAEQAAIMEAIERARPHLLCVGLGSPRQEKWLHGQRSRLAAAVAMGIGGAIDVWAGTAVRAPALWRRAGLEWLYRLYREPRRWRRMLALPRFALAVVRWGDQPLGGSWRR